MYNHTLHRKRKHFCFYYLQPFSTEAILKCRIKHCFKINDKLEIIMHKNADKLYFLTQCCLRSIWKTLCMMFL